MFIKRTSSGFAIIIVYVDDMNLISTLEVLRDIATYLKSEFEMKDLGKTRFLGLVLEHRDSGILIHHSACVYMMLMRFNMDKVHPISTLMINWTLDQMYDQFHQKDDDEETLWVKVLYLSAISTLLYLISMH